MDYLSSMYIDNEMDLDEKKQFVEKVRSDQAFYSQTLELLEQEQLLRKQPFLPDLAPEQRWQPPVWDGLKRFFRPLGFATAGFTAAVLIFLGVFQPPVPPLCSNRFVLYRARRRPGGTGRVVHRVAADFHAADRQQRILGGQSSASCRRAPIRLHPGRRPPHIRPHPARQRKG